jgi:hypothetical protein
MTSASAPHIYSFFFFTVHQMLCGDQIKADDMGACSKHGQMRNMYKILIAYLQWKSHLSELRIDGSVIFK